MPSTIINSLEVIEKSIFKVIKAPTKCEQPKTKRYVRQKSSQKKTAFLLGISFHFWQFISCQGFDASYPCRQKDQAEVCIGVQNLHAPSYTSGPLTQICTIADSCWIGMGFHLLLMSQDISDVTYFAIISSRYFVDKRYFIFEWCLLHQMAYAFSYASWL